MTWETFYLTCFFLGLALSALAFFSGVFRLHLPAKLHLPHALQHSGIAHASTATDIPFFNLSSLMAFLCWFGGMGYLLTHYSRIWFALAFLLSLASGLGGAAIVFWFLLKVLVQHENPLSSEDFEMVGVVGSVTSSIRAGGTGEMQFLQEGTRRVAGARSADGEPIAKGTEIVVTRYEKGIAFVRPWAEFADEHRLDVDGKSREAQPKVN